MLLKKIVPLLFLIVVFSSFQNQQPNNTISGKWKLISISHVRLADNSNRPKSYGNSLLLFEFKDDGENGTIKGRTTSNNVRGRYQLSDNQEIKVTSFGGTKVAEHGWGSDFWNNIRSATSYQISSGNLLIYYDSGKRVMKFIPQ